MMGFVITRSKTVPKRARSLRYRSIETTARMPKSGTESEIAMLITPRLSSPSRAAATARPKIASLVRNTLRISTPRRRLSLLNFGTSQAASA